MLTFIQFANKVLEEEREERKKEKNACRVFKLCRNEKDRERDIGKAQRLIKLKKKEKKLEQAENL